MNLKQNGTRLIKTSSLSANKVIPKEYNLIQPYPNPFNPSLSIPIDIKQRSNVNITIFDINLIFK